MQGGTPHERMAAAGGVSEVHIRAIRSLLEDPHFDGERCGDEGRTRACVCVCVNWEGGGRRLCCLKADWKSGVWLAHKVSMAR